MKFSATLSAYLAKTYFANLTFLFLGLLGVTYLFDTVELIRRANKIEGVPLSLVLQMGLLKLPEVAQVLIPFAVLFSAMFTFWQLTRRYELVVVRSTGFSVWQFLAPVMGVSVIVAILYVTVVNPIGSLLLGKFEELENRYLNRSESQIIALFKEGLWLRQGAENDGYMILNAERVKQPNWTLENLSVLFFEKGDNFQKRLDAPEASLEEGRWLFRDALIHDSSGVATQQPSFALPTNLTRKDVEDSFASPETMSFWALPSHIQTLEDTGFDASRLQVHYHNLLAQPLLFAAMILLAASVSMRPPRFHGTFGLIVVGVFIGFFVFFMSSFLQALGASQQIPAILAAWSPGLVFFLLGLSVVMNLEDG
jgi:lipopolysaccharide export system permease protein